MNSTLPWRLLQIYKAGRHNFLPCLGRVKHACAFAGRIHLPGDPVDCQLAGLTPYAAQGYGAHIE
jgi:hypothetical protein